MRAMPSAPLTILLVEDQEDSRDLMAFALTRRGYRVETAASGQEALDRLCAGAVDVALIDLGLPDMPGDEVARQATARLGAATPVLIALTGRSLEADLQRTRSAGFRDHLVKPASVAHIARVIDDALAAE